MITQEVRIKYEILLRLVKAGMGIEQAAAFTLGDRCKIVSQLSPEQQHELFCYSSCNEAGRKPTLSDIQYFRESMRPSILDMNEFEDYDRSCSVSKLGNYVVVIVDCGYLSAGHRCNQDIRKALHFTTTYLANEAIEYYKQARKSNLSLLIQRL